MQEDEILIRRILLNLSIHISVKTRTNSKSVGCEQVKPFWDIVYRAKLMKLNETERRTFT